MKCTYHVYAKCPPVLQYWLHQSQFARSFTLTAFKTSTMLTKFPSFTAITILTTFTSSDTTLSKNSTTSDYNMTFTTVKYTYLSVCSFFLKYGSKLFIIPLGTHQHFRHFFYYYFFKSFPLHAAIIFSGLILRSF